MFGGTTTHRGSENLTYLTYEMPQSRTSRRAVASVQNVAGAGALLAELQQYFDLPPQPDGGDTDVVNPDQP